MNVATFSGIFAEAAQSCGLDRTLNTRTFKLFRDFASLRLQDIWERQPWPDLLVYADVTSDSDFIASLPSDCGAVLEVWDSDPKTSSQALQVPYELIGDNLHLPNEETYTLKYRKTAPTLTGDDYDAGTTYAVGSQVYSGGQFWDCILLSLGNTPSTGSNYWERVDVPLLFRVPLVRGAAADYLKSESQFEQAAMMEAEYEAAVERATDNFLRQQQQSETRMRMVFTY